MATWAWQRAIAAGIERAGGLSTTTRPAALALIVGLTAAIPRLLGLASRTPGFRELEATTALMGRRVNAGNLPIFFGQEQDAATPFFPYLVKITGELAGWGVTGPRLAAALCGIVAAVCCALWLARALGDIWGLVAGLLAATSFWQLMFSRQAVPPISTATFTALGLWLAWLGLERGRRPQPESLLRRSDLLWYAAAGAAFGLGFFSHASYTVVPPLVLLTAGLLALSQQRARSSADALGPALLLLAMTVAMTPLAGYYLDNTENFRRALDLAAGLPDDLISTDDDVASGLLGLAWIGSDQAEMNLPGRPLLDPILAAWGVAGLLAALRRPHRALPGTLLIWLLLGVLAIGLVGGNTPSLYLPLAPVLAAFPVLGMQSVWALARDRDARLRRLAGTLIAASILASAGWSLYDYFWQWSGSEESYLAMRGDVRDAAEALDALPDDGHAVYFYAGDAGRIVRYLAPERTRHDLLSDHQLPLPARGDAYLIAPRSTAPEEQLLAFVSAEDLVLTGAGPGGTEAYRVWLAGPRTLELLPYSAPAMPFANGWRLIGWDARAAPMPPGAHPEMEIVLLWQVPPDADPYDAVVRLDPLGEGSLAPTFAEVRVAPWKHTPIPGGEFLLVFARQPFPQTDELTANLTVALRDPSSRRLINPLSNAQNGYAFLNRVQVVVP